eukprot:CAMPEP_0179162456 /NCGR_PEP_ID=MMETSP0796-20121207/79587_1 /TAXON_ID=73915 /ORGANISM="Pyrodinium bahamense, Strain pbaha01" /LENGTH=470 /DNA_ID=CAMNT_0020864663 /DNA_START=1 /DNA_END=1410 /DNA_ORIENTATION=-
MASVPISEAACARRPPTAMDFLVELFTRRARSFRERLCLQEASGSLGDLGTLLPLLAGCARLGSVRLGPAIFWMGVFNVISGVQWDIPMPVQPMKSIAAVAISDGLSPGTFAAAGLLTGAAVTQTIDLANRAIPRCVVAGMQVGLGLRMAAQGCGYWHGRQWLDGVDCKLTALACLVLTLVLMLRTRLPTALIIFTLGLGLTIIKMVHDGASFGFGAFEWEVIVPHGAEWLDGLVEGALPQLPLTTLNSVISICALSAELFGRPEDGGKGATRVSVACSVGLMNLVGCWFGGMPSCHGAGGLAGQYRFGARSGMSILMLGTAKIVVALSFGQTLNELIVAYPMTVLGVLLLFAGVELASVGARSLRASEAFEEDLLPCFVTAGAYIGTKNMALGVSAGLIASAVLRLEWESIGSLVSATRRSTTADAEPQHKSVSDGSVGVMTSTGQPAAVSAAGGICVLAADGPQALSG